MSGSAGTPEPAGERLLRALGLFLQFVDTGGKDVDALLRQHEDLRELLEPMLRGRGEKPVAAPPPPQAGAADESVC
jgi:hypothetical protein